MLCDAEFALAQTLSTKYRDAALDLHPAVGLQTHMSESEPRKAIARLDESLLTHLKPFSRLERSQIRLILDQATSRRYDEGTTVFSEGTAAERFFMLLDGFVRVIHVTETGEQVIALHIPAGQMFGIARALGRDTYPASAITASEAIILSWPMRLWDDFLTYDGFSLETARTVGQRVGEMNTRMMELATQQVEQRIANALLRLINQTGRKVEGGIEINFPITRQDLSELTATTLHTVSRTLSTWEKLGLVKSQRKKITVTDAHKLVLLSQPRPAP